MVEPVYGDTVAGLDRRFRIGHYTRERREGSIDASNHCQIRVRLFDAGTGDGFATGEETFSHVGALRGDWLAAGERIGHIPKSERQVSQA